MTMPAGEVVENVNPEEIQVGELQNNEPSNDLLENLNLSEEQKTKLQSDTELLGILSHNLKAKRDANAEAKANREAYEQLKAEKDQAETERLKNEKEFKKLYEQELTRNTKIQNDIKQNAINSKVSMLATQKGLKNPSYLKMFDTSGIEVDDNYNVQGLEEKFEAFVSTYPDLFGSDVKPVIDNSKPNLGNNQSIQAELNTLTKAARTGNIRELARLREFKKKHNIPLR
jgi:hypothetical protein